MSIFSFLELHKRDFLNQKCGSVIRSEQQRISYDESNFREENYFEALVAVQIPGSNIS
jgi:hypothetical protein